MSDSKPKAYFAHELPAGCLVYRALDIDEMLAESKPLPSSPDPETDGTFASAPLSDRLPSSPTSEGREAFKGHTPGPWWYSDRMVLGGPHAEYICEVTGAASHPSHKADALLIAAAPDLLRENTALRASLTEAQAEISVLRSKERGLAEWSETLGDLSEARAALAEAQAELTHLRAEHERLKEEKKQLRDAAETFLADVSESEDHTSWFNSIAALNKVLRKQEYDGAQ